MVNLRKSDPTFAVGDTKVVNENGVLLIGRFESRFQIFVVG